MTLRQNIKRHTKRWGTALAALSLMIGLQALPAGVARAEPVGTFTPGTPQVYGSAIVGSSLWAEVGFWDPTPDSYAFQWLRDGSAVSGAADATYPLTSADLGHKLSVTVTATKTGYTTASATSAQTSTVANPDAPTLSAFTATSAVIRSGKCASIPLSIDYTFSPYQVTSITKVTVTAKVTNKKGKKIGTATLSGTGPSMASIGSLKGTATGTFTWCTGDYLGKVTFGPATATWSGEHYTLSSIGTPVSGKISSSLKTSARVRAAIAFGTPVITAKGTKRTLSASFVAYRPDRQKWTGLKKGSVVTIQKQVGGAWVKVKTIKIGSKGKVTASWKASTSATYRVVWAGSGTKDKAVSTVVTG